MSGDTVRLGAPDGRVAEVDGVTGRRYKAKGGGMYEMHPRDAAAFKAEGAFVPSIGGPTIRGGYTCPACGFKAVIRTCSRCGEHCETDAERRARLTAQAAAATVPVADEFVMVYEQRSDGSLREIGPAYGPPIATRPQDWAEPARSHLFGAGSLPEAGRFSQAAGRHGEAVDFRMRG